MQPAIHMKRLCMESEMLHYFLGGTFYWLSKAT